MIPDEEIDLVVFSEIGYYFTETQLYSVATATRQADKP